MIEEQEHTGLTEDDLDVTELEARLEMTAAGTTVGASSGCPGRVWIFVC